MGIMLVVATVVVLLIVAAAKNENSGENDPVSEVTTQVATEPTQEASTSATEGVDPSTDTSMSIVELENSWYLAALATVGVEGMSGNEVESEGYTNQELIDMGRNACSALGETGGDFDLLFAQIYVLVGEDEAALTFAGKVVGAAVNSYCMEWIPAMTEYVEV